MELLVRCAVQDSMPNYVDQLGKMAPTVRRAQRAKRRAAQPTTGIKTGKSIRRIKQDYIIRNEQTPSFYTALGWEGRARPAPNPDNIGGESELHQDNSH